LELSRAFVPSRRPAPEGDAVFLAAKLLWAIAEPYFIANRELLLCISVGVVDAGQRRDWAQLFHDCSAAMDRARQEGAGKMFWFNSSEDGQLQQTWLIEQELRSANDTAQLYMVYQPIYDLRRDRLSGFEALMSWHNPKRGNVPPDVFSPLAERSGLLLPVERMVKRAPLLATSDWPAHFRVSINCPASEFRDRTLPQRMLRGLNRAGPAADRCFWEVPESALLENDEIVLTVTTKLKEMGIRLALDDFRTGHASLSYLHRFPFECIKIDESFIRDMHLQARGCRDRRCDDRLDPAAWN
jgi:diguanylate cyclase